MIFRPSGGALYHWRAWREAQNWQAFRRQVQEWLMHFHPPTSELILLGPSAGYTLPTPWLQKFKSITAYDLDPLAPWLFRKRHPGTNVEFHRRDVFWSPAKKLDFSLLQTIAEERPQAAILFCNVLGQILLEGRASEAQWQTYLRELRQGLAARHWASYHDLFTHENGEVIDHLMKGDWSRALPSTPMLWQLSANSRHEIEGLIQTP